MSSNQYTVICDHCDADINKPCKTKAGHKTSTHKCRVDAAAALAAKPVVEVDGVKSFMKRMRKQATESRPEVMAESFQELVAVMSDLEYHHEVRPTDPVEIAFSEPQHIHVPTETELPQPISFKQVLHVINGGTLGKRSRIAYPGLPTKFNMEEHFLPHERRAYLEKYMPCSFAIVSEEDLKQALVVLADGLKVEGAALQFDGEVFTGFVKDGSGATLILTPRGIEVTFADLGIRCMIKKSTDVGKFMKYLKRLFAMYRHAAHGTDQVFVDAHDAGPTLLYKSNGESFRIRYDSPLPKNFKIEGCSFVTPRWANAQLGLNPDTGRKWKVGQTARITFTCGKFMWKGHVMVWDMKNVDATFWDCKTVIGTDGVFVGLMGTLHAGDLHLGSQEIVDWGLMNYADKLAKLAIESYADEMHAPDFATKKFEAMFGKKLQEDDPDGTTAAQITKWRFMNAVNQKNSKGEAAFNFHHEPFMQRDGYRAFEQNVCDVKNGRVPVPATDGFRAYYFIDPSCITDDGTFDPSRKRLAGNCVYSPKLKHGTKIVTFRNPHTIHEYVLCNAVAPTSAWLDIDPNVMLVSIDIAMDFAEDQGGGDYDDCGNVYFCKEVVSHFTNHVPAMGYPARLPVRVNIAEKTVDIMESNFLVRRYNLNMVKFDKVKLADKIRAVIDSDAGVGMIDNYLRVCMVFSLYKPQILADLEKQLAVCEHNSPEHNKLSKARFWMQAYTIGQENVIASAFEDAIDGIVMNGAKGGVDASLGQMIRDFWAQCPVVQYWATIGGHNGNGRIPKACRENDPVVVMCPISVCIKQMESYGDALNELVNIKQWLGLQMAPAAVRNYPCTPEVQKVADVAHAAWKKSNRSIREVKQSKKESYKAFRSICTHHRDALNLRGHEFTMMFMAELERRAYDGPYGAPKMYNGRPVGGPDGYINQPEFFSLRVQLYKELGLVVETQALTRAMEVGSSAAFLGMTDEDLAYEKAEEMRDLLETVGMVPEGTDGYAEQLQAAEILYA